MSRVPSPNHHPVMPRYLEAQFHDLPLTVADVLRYPVASTCLTKIVLDRLA